MRAEIRAPWWRKLWAVLRRRRARPVRRSLLPPGESAALGASPYGLSALHDALYRSGVSREEPERAALGMGRASLRMNPRYGLDGDYRQLLPPDER